MNNIMAETIKHVGDKAQYNACCKELLSYKPILSRILKETVTEYQNVPIEIIQECIEGSPEISVIPVNSTAPCKIVGSDTTDIKPNEGSLYYDIKFQTYTPDTQHRVKMYINVEAQKKYIPYGFV